MSETHYLYIIATILFIYGLYWWGLYYLEKKASKNFDWDTLAIRKEGGIMIISIPKDQLEDVTDYEWERMGYIDESEADEYK